MLNPHYRICLVAFLIDLAVMISITVLPFYVFNQIGGGAGLSGAIGATQAAFYAITCLGSAAFVSRTKNGLTWAFAGIALFGASSCALPMFRGPLVCGAIATASMTALALVWPALHSWVGAEPDPHRRARRMSLFNISWSFGFAISPLAAGPLYDHDYRLPFVLLFVVVVTTLIVLRTVPRETDHYGAVSQDVIDARAGHDRASEVYLYAAWCATLMGSLLAGVTRTIYPKQVEDLVASGQLRILFEEVPASFLTAGAATKYSWLAFALGLTAAFSFLVLGRTRHWQHNFHYLFWLQVAAAAAFWILGGTHSLIVMAVCFIITGALCGVSFFSGVYYSMANPEHKHRRAAINEGVVGVGGFAGSMGFGYLAERYGLAMPFHYAPLLIAAGLAVQILLLQYGIRRQRANDVCR